MRNFIHRHAKRPARFDLMASVSRLNETLPPDHANVRFEIAKRVLGREPVVVFHPWNPSQVIYVEGAPDDWRDFIEQRMEEGKLGDVMRDAEVVRRAN